MRSRAEIEFLLTEELARATRQFREAVAEFQTAISAAPPELPNPDGSLRLKQAGTRKRAALEALNDALNRQSQFVLDGKIPDDLLKDDLSSDDLHREDLAENEEHA